MQYKILYFIKALFFTLSLVSLIAFALAFYKHSQEIIQWIDGLGWLAPFLFLITYCLATLLLLPTMILTLAGGAIFGPVIGLILNLIGATTGAAFAFLITRYLTHRWVLKNRNEKFQQLIAGVDEKGWMFVAFLRLIPVIPFNLVNYGMGITSIKFRLYLIATFFFLIPAEIIYTYCGYAGMDALLQPGHFYRNAGIVFLAIAILIPCFITLKKLLKPRTN